MDSYNIVAVVLSTISYSFSGEGVRGIFFLQLRITYIALVPKDIIYPPTLPVNVQHIALIQHLCDLCGVYPSQIHFVYTANHRRVLLIDNKRTVYEVIAQRSATGIELSALHPLLVAPAHIAGDGLALALGEGCVQGCHQLRGHPCGVNILFLEEDGRTIGSELPDGLQALCRIAGKARGGLDQNAVHESAAAVVQHPFEILPFLHRGAGDALVGVDVHQPPVLMFHDVLCIVDVLRCEGIELILRG